MFPASLKDVYKKLKSVSRKLQECFKEVSGKFQGCFNKVLRGFQVRLKDASSYFKGGSWVERSLKDFRVFQGSFQWGFKGI